MGNYEIWINRSTVDREEHKAGYLASVFGQSFSEAVKIYVETHVPAEDRDRWRYDAAQDSWYFDDLLVAQSEDEAKNAWLNQDWSKFIPSTETK